MLYNVFITYYLKGRLQSYFSRSALSQWSGNFGVGISLAGAKKHFRDYILNVLNQKFYTLESFFILLQDISRDG